jgi:hypothetical protein
MNPIFKGRQKGALKRVSVIEDEALGDYKIAIDEECMKVVFTDPKSKTEKILGYPTRLSSALMIVSKHKSLNKPNYTIKEYINEIKTTFENLTNSVSI